MKLLIYLIAILSSLQAISQRRESFSIHFDFDKYELTSKALTQLDSFLTVRQGHFGSIKIELHGHCDHYGTDSYNDQLSLQRVNTVKNHLLKHNLPESVISVASYYGEKEPLNDNSSAEERQLNRRVELVVIETNISVPEAIVEKPVGDTTLRQKMADSTVKAGTNIVLKNINFHGGMHRFLPGSLPQLQELLEIMKTYPTLVIEIQGHICCEPDPGDGLDIETGLHNLSEARAREVRQYLIDNGIAGTRVAYRGFGHSMPIHPYPELTEAQRIDNRRVEIKIISK